GIEFESHIDGNLIRRLMEYASMYGVKLFCRVNDPALQGEGVMHEGSVSSRLGLAGIPAVAESSQVARIGEFADFYGVDVIILGVSTPRSLKICSQNRYLHPQVSLHHLILSDEACDNYDTAAKIWPPLREKSMREELVKILAKSGDAIIGSLHTPVSETAKDAVFSEASYGIEGLENFLPLLYTFLVKDRHIDFPALVEMVSKNPAESVGMGDRKGSVEIGQEADIILFDPDFTSIVKNPSSPYRDMKIFGKVITFKQLTS
ncbi:MAG: amidohydrolase family protein, partial [Hydrogenimonas sp.]|nr:amidohydrolase family protein [Hydrogenimonas sp.]